MSETGPVAALAPDRAARFRSTVIGIAEDFMRRRMGLEVEVVTRVVNSARSNTAWIEYAHTPHLPHVGTARIIQFAAEYSSNQNGSFILYINDHLAPRDIPEARYLPLAVAGSVIAKAPTLGLSGVQTKQGMHCLSPPSERSINSMRSRWTDIIPKAKNEINEIMDVMASWSQRSSDHSAFLTNSMIQYLDPPPLCVPSSVLIGAARITESELISDLDSWGHLWIVCSSCGYRLGRPDTHVESCPVCKSRETPDLMPDVVARQVLSNVTNLSRRVCGQNKPYQEVSDATSSKLNIAPPARIHVTGKVSTIMNSKIVDRINIYQLISERGIIRFHEFSEFKDIEVRL